MKPAVATKRRIAVVVTARPSYARVRSVLEAIRDDPRLELQLVLGASALLARQGSLVEIVRDDGFEVTAQVHLVVEGDHPVAAAKSTGLGILEMAPLIDRLDPAVVLTIADRYETLATAVATSYLHRPLAHLQGGEISGSIDEKVRHAVTKLADLHFVANTAARNRVVAMGEHVERVYVTGCPSIDLALTVRDRFANEPFDPSTIVAMDDRAQRAVRDRGYLMVMQHPVTTNHQRAAAELLETLAAVKALALPVFWFRPNVDPGSRAAVASLRHRLEGIHQAPILWVDNLPPEDFLRLLLGARCLVGNSSAGVREGAFLGVPTVNVGGRQAGRDRGPNLVDVVHDRKIIADAVQGQLDRQIVPDPLYGDGRSGQRIGELLATVPLDSAAADSVGLDDTDEPALSIATSAQ